MPYLPLSRLLLVRPVVKYRAHHPGRGRHGTHRSDGGLCSLPDCGNLPSRAQKRCGDPQSEWGSLRRQGPSDGYSQSSVDPDGCPIQDKTDQPQVVPSVAIAGTYVFPLGQSRSGAAPGAGQRDAGFEVGEEVK